MTITLEAIPNLGFNIASTFVSCNNWSLIQFISNASRGNNTIINNLTTPLTCTDQGPENCVCSEKLRILHYCKSKIQQCHMAHFLSLRRYKNVFFYYQENRGRPGNVVFWFCFFKRVVIITSCSAWASREVKRIFKCVLCSLLHS